MHTQMHTYLRTYMPAYVRNMQLCVHADGNVRGKCPWRNVRGKGHSNNHLKRKVCNSQSKATSPFQAKAACSTGQMTTNAMEQGLCSGSKAIKSKLLHNII